MGYRRRTHKFRDGTVVAAGVSSTENANGTSDLHPLIIQN
jgi:hypothetical protein